MRLRVLPALRATPYLSGLLLLTLSGASFSEALGRSDQPKPTAPRATPAPPAESPQPQAGAHRVEVRGEWFYVDGEPFLVKGIGYSPYRPGQVPWRDQVDLAVMERDFQRIAAAGFNTIRTWSPLRPEALALADRYGLMVLQGIWVERQGNYSSKAFQEAVVSIVRREVERADGHGNILAFLVGNELLPERVYETGAPAVEAVLRRAAQVVRETGPGRLVSYANWPTLAFLDPSPWDAICFNLYPYEPANVSHVFGFRGYVEHLKRTAARSKPLVISEVGLSVSPVAGSKAGYGGMSRAVRREELLKLWDALFQGGAQGGVIFEWNDEWWKQGDSAGDEETHEDGDPEEWFGLVEFTASDRVDGSTRPAYDALKTYNQAILLSPVSGRWYQQQVPVTVYATPAVTQVRARLNKGQWHAAVKVNRHWWKVLVPIGPNEAPGEHGLTLEAYDDAHRLIARQERPVLVGDGPIPALASLTTDRVSYEADHALESVRYTITVTDPLGHPLPERPVYWSVIEPLANTNLTQTKTTDANGRVEGTYLVHEPGLLLLSAATPIDPAIPARRAGTEVAVTVRQAATLRHYPSIWEAGLPEELRAGLHPPKPAFQLADPGTEQVVDYDRYGSFVDAGTSAYRYEVRDWEGLAAAAGEGVYPNEGGLMRDPAYQAAQRSGKLEGSHWDFTWHEDPQRAFFKWAGTDEESGVKQFFIALTLERAGLFHQAVKAYEAVLVHFPTSIGWTAFDPPTPWYVGVVARDKIDALARLHPELGLRLEGASLVVRNGFDNDLDNDVFLVNPGRLVSVAPDAVNPPPVDLTQLAVKRTIGRGRVQTVQLANGHWQLRVDGRPWTVRGLTYLPSAVGETPDEGTLKDWVSADRNGNGQADVLETFVDVHQNDRQDPDEPVVGDFALIRDMGVNTLRLFHTNHDPKAAKPFLRTLHEQHGFMVMMGDFVGMYTIGSGAKWEEGTDYLDPAQRKRMFEGVKRMVRDYKEEPYLLMWVLGNENNYGGVHGIVGGVGNAGQHPDEYYRFINELAMWIHREDPDHPVAIGNGEWLFLDRIAAHAPAIDIFGANMYRGSHGFGRSFFEAVKRTLDRPVLVTEFGCPAYQLGQPREIAERDQALYHLGNWVDLADNMAGRGVGNAIGGVVFEWSDEWWKAGQPPRFLPAVQETVYNWPGPFPGGHMFEEWLGVVGQGDGSHSPFLRQLRPSYRLYRQMWKASE